jgi:hypothetical protein
MLSAPKIRPRLRFTFPQTLSSSHPPMTNAFSARNRCANPPKNAKLSVMVFRNFNKKHES